MRWLLMGLLAGGVGLAVPETAWADELPTAEQLLGGIDENLTFESRTSTVTMTVKTARRTRSYEMRTYGRGASEAAIEYLAPVRDKGTRILRKSGEVWMYLPSVERTQKISGHMLREGMMGSDVSYEDMTSASSWRDAYQATVEGEDTIDGRRCYKMVMVANDESITYPKRVAWVDAETKIPIRQELYAVSGMLVKTWTMTDVREYEGGRRFPSTMKISDALQAGSETVLELTDITFGVALEDEVFSVRWLERGGG